MPINKESEIVSNKEAQKDEIATRRERAKQEADAKKDLDKRGAELDKKFGGDGKANDKKTALERCEEIKKLLRESIKKADNAKKDLSDFALALQEKRADLPNKRDLTVEEFNDFRNDLNMILQERDQAAESSEDLLSYVIEKIRTDAIA